MFKNKQTEKTTTNNNKKKNNYYKDEGRDVRIL